MAVKEITLKKTQLGPEILKSIHEEMAVMKQLNHENVTKYYGIDPQMTQVFIFMEVIFFFVIKIFLRKYFHFQNLVLF